MRRFISDDPVRLEMVKARVTVEEKTALAEVANSLGLSIAQVVREGAKMFGLKELQANPTAKAKFIASMRAARLAGEMGSVH